MADLRSRFIEDYAGGLLNISRQELSTTGEVLVQDGFTSEGTIFVEDGSGTKSGLKLGVSLAESVDPTTETGIVNVRYADRTYAKIRDLKIFSTAIASAQAALSEATSTSLLNLETAFQLLEDGISSIEQNFQQNFVQNQEQLQILSLSQRDNSERLTTAEVAIQNLENRVTAFEVPSEDPDTITEFVISQNTFYYAGTIEISGGSVIGTNTLFSSQLTVGDTFLATTSDGEEVEFRVLEFGQSPAINLTVSPNNKTIDPGSRYRRNEIKEIKQKINEIISSLRKSKLLV